MTDAHAAVANFDRCYCDLVDLLCSAARHGASPQAHARYGTCRERASRAYTAVAALLDLHAGAAADTGEPFGPLLACASLDDALNDADLLPRLTHGRAALDAWIARAPA